MRIEDLNRNSAYSGGLAFDNMEFQVNFQPAARETSSVVFMFHGSANRERRPLPVFPGFWPGLRESAHQFAITDPCLFQDESIRIGWYLGYEGLPLQDILPRFFDAVASHIGCQRKVFFGGSGGGFAALYYASRSSGSVAVAVNPQTILAKRPRPLSIYREKCWPSVGDVETLSEKVDLDLSRVYAGGPDTSLVLIQNTTDYHHMNEHMVPLLSALSKREAENYLLEAGFWGAVGHAAPPRDVTQRWLCAATRAASASCEDIAQEHHRLSSLGASVGSAGSPARPAPRRPRPRPATPEFDSNDIAIADALATWSLQ